MPLKITLPFFCLSLSMVSPARAQDPLNCLRWQLVTENEFRTPDQAGLLANSILNRGASVHFFVEETHHTPSSRVYNFSYDRGLVFQSEKSKLSYEQAMKNMMWHLNSEIGVHVGCVLEAPEPRPRISGSN